MKNKAIYLPVLLCLLCFMQSGITSADQHATTDAAKQKGFRGKVLKFSGDVEVINARGEVRKVTEVNEPLQENDTVITRQDARVVVEFNDGALSVLNEQSRLRVEKTSWFSYLGGKIYFTFKKVFGEPRRIKTRAATIGIRGTTFIISENIDQRGESIALKEGVLKIESNGPAFEIHKLQVLSEYEQFRSQQFQARQTMVDEFQQYKQQMQNEFIEYRRQFTLQENRVMNLQGYRVNEMELSDEHLADFASFEAEAEEMIRRFRQ